jgi:SAM-dependent methyltransferase
MGGNPHYVNKTMKLIDLVNRKPVPDPWSEGDNIPWNNPDFSQRMLKEHLTQDHDAASRKLERINQHVVWIHSHVLLEKPSKVLDLGCGPGLYAHRLAALGHQCVGIDYSPASINYARTIAMQEHLDCVFQEADIREADYGSGFDIVMQIYGELNVFRPAHAEVILEKAYQALKPGGRLLLEPHTYDAVQNWGKRPPSWYTSTCGLFSPTPYIVMEECFWNPEAQAATNRYFIIDAATGEVTRYAQSIQAYTQQDYTTLLRKCGYTNISFYPSLTGKPDPKQTDLLALLATKTE